MDRHPDTSLDTASDAVRRSAADARLQPLEKAEIDAREKRVADLMAQRDAAYAELSALEREGAFVQHITPALSAEIDAARRRIATLGERIADLNNALSRRRSDDFIARGRKAS